MARHKFTLLHPSDKELLGIDWTPYYSNVEDTLSSINLTVDPAAPVEDNFVVADNSVDNSLHQSWFSVTGGKQGSVYYVYAQGVFLSGKKQTESFEIFIK